MKKNLFITLSFIVCIIPMMLIDVWIYFYKQWMFCKGQIEKKELEVDNY